MSEPTNITAADAYSYCIHGTAPYLICQKCAEMHRQEKRDEALYAILDRLAAAVDKLAGRL